MTIHVDRYGITVMAHSCEWVFNACEGEPWARVLRFFDFARYTTIRVGVR